MMNVQDFEQRQTGVAQPAGTDEGLQTRGVEGSEPATPSPFGAEKIAAFDADVKNALNVAADVAGTTVQILTSGYRLSTYCMMRQIVAYWLHKEKGYSKRDIAVAINRDRSTIYHAVKRIDSLLEIGDRLTTHLWNRFSTTMNLNRP
jgi:hypothetical protein